MRRQAFPDALLLSVFSVCAHAAPLRVTDWMKFPEFRDEFAPVSASAAAGG